MSRINLTEISIGETTPVECLGTVEKVMDSIAKLIGTLGYPKFPRINPSYFFEKITQILNTISQLIQVFGILAPTLSDFNQFL